MSATTVELMAAIHKQGYDTSKCQNCHAPETAALKYKCGSYWTATDEKIELRCSPVCTRRGQQMQALVSLVQVARETQTDYDVLEVDAPTAIVGSTERWRVTVLRVIDGSKKPRQTRKQRRPH